MFNVEKWLLEQCLEELGDNKKILAEFQEDYFNDTHTKWKVWQKYYGRIRQEELPKECGKQVERNGFDLKDKWVMKCPLPIRSRKSNPSSFAEKKRIFYTQFKDLFSLKLLKSEKKKQRIKEIIDTVDLNDTDDVTHKFELFCFEKYGLLEIPENREDKLLNVFMKNITS